MCLHTTDDPEPFGAPKTATHELIFDKTSAFLVGLQGSIEKSKREERKAKTGSRPFLGQGGNQEHGLRQEDTPHVLASPR